VGLDEIAFTPVQTVIDFNSEGWSHAENLGTSLTRSGFVFSHYNSSLVPATIYADVFGEGNSLDLYLDQTYFVIKKTDGSEFDFQRMYVVGDNNQTITIAGYRNTKSVVSQSVVTTNIGAVVSPSTLNAGFKNVDSVVVSTDLHGGWDSFVFGSPLDQAPPDVKSIVVSGSPGPTATSIDYTVTFYENAKNISADDFQLTTTGSATGAISSVSAPSGTSVTVTVNAVSGTGTLRLDMKSNTNIIDNNNNGNNTNGYADAFTTGVAHSVDLDAPTVSNVSEPSDGTYIAGQDLDFTINTNENVTVNTTGGTPQLSITIGSTTRQAIYQSGSGTSALLFRYTVQSGELDTDGITVGTLSANGGTMRDGAGNDMNTTLNSVGSTALVLVDAVTPTVSSVNVPSNGTYLADQNLDFSINTSENVTVNTTGGTPQLSLTIGSAIRQAAYLSGSGTAALVFRYTVQSGDLDTDGIAVGTLSANGGTLQDGAGNNLDEALNSIGSTNQVLVVAIPPTITSFTPASGPVGTSVTLTGSNFNTTADSNIVYFGATRATVTAATATQLTVTVPGGSTYEPITVLNSATKLCAYSASPFTVTFGSGLGQQINSGSFLAKTDFTSNTEPTVEISDIDGDGKPDMVATNYDDGTMSIFRNTSTSETLAFATKVDFTTGPQPFLLGFGDLDGDGKPEVVTPNRGDNTISIFHNTSSSGTISFDTKIDFATANTPGFVSIQDIDGDGKPDVIIGYQDPALVSVFRNTSTSVSVSFAARVDFSTTGLTGSIAVGDIDGDGKSDIVANNWINASVSVLRNTSTPGTVSFATKVDFATGTNPWFVSIGDLDGDGKPDLAITNYSDNTVSVLRNTSSIGSISFATKVDFATGTNPQGVNIADLDGDGKLDIIEANLSDNSVSVFQNKSLTGSIAFATKVDMTTGASPSIIAVADLNGDGKPDIAIANNASISVLLNNLDITPPATPTSLTATPGNTQNVLTWTVNGETDLASYKVFGGTVANPTTLLATVNQPTITYTHAGLSNGTTYYYRIFAVDNVGNESDTMADVSAVPKEKPVITFDATNTVTYGTMDYAPGAVSTNSGVTITYSSSNTSVATIVTGKIHVLNAGTTTITASQAGDAAHFAAADADQTLTVDKVVLSVTTEDKSKTYGDANPVLTLMYSGFVNGDDETDLTTQAMANTETTASSGAGTYAITASGAASPNYTFSYTDGTLTVNKAALTITADDKNKTNGDANPFLTLMYSGFVNGDDETDLTTQAMANTEATASSGAGTYAITASGAASPNYTFSYTDGTLTVNKAVLTITADDKNKTYGDANSALTVMYSDFVNSEDSTNLTALATANTTATASSGAGTYAITANGAVSDNYTFSYTDGTLTVNKAVLTITADDKNKTYGDANPALTVMYSGFVNNEDENNLTMQATANTTATASSVAGTYAITASGAASDNYTFNYSDGTLTINKAELSVTADSATRIKGEANPDFTIHYSGFVMNEDSTVLTTLPIATCQVDPDSPEGEYEIVVSGGTADNYHLNYVSGILTITPSTGIDHDLTEKVKLYPNPSVGKIFIEVPVTGNTLVNVIDLNGRIILQKSFSGPQIMLDLENVAKGIHWIKIQGSNKSWTLPVLLK
jgi:hypothetical protein